MIAIGDKAYALKDGRLWPWSFKGYGKPVAIDTPGAAAIRLITPPTTVAALKAGYRPIWHSTAGSGAG